MASWGLFEFVRVALSFPVVLFTFALLVVIGFWLLVLVGGTETESVETDSATQGLDALGLGGVPVTVAVTGLVGLSWFTTLAGTVAVAGLSGLAGVLARCGVLIVAVPVAVAGTRLVVLPLRRVFGAVPAASHRDFVGRMCRVRTGRVDEEFGQAELTAADGSSAVIQVRQSALHAATAPLAQGDSAVVYDYDPAAGTFWVAAWEGN
ncbi:hypothetical protein ACFC06_26250 [Nocardia sp. NPDC056064]|uniref:hypothetical protein n=1 Tax=Nocardia sp. NPDC056064 TaxID=3345701 RepID=UPI0035E17A94